MPELRYEIKVEGGGQAAGEFARVGDAAKGVDQAAIGLGTEAKEAGTQLKQLGQAGLAAERALIGLRSGGISGLLMALQAVGQMAKLAAASLGTSFLGMIAGVFAPLAAAIYLVQRRGEAMGREVQAALDAQKNKAEAYHKKLEETAKAEEDRLKKLDKAMHELAAGGMQAVEDRAKSIKARFDEALASMERVKKANDEYASAQEDLSRKQRDLEESKAKAGFNQEAVKIDEAEKTGAITPEEAARRRAALGKKQQASETEFDRRRIQSQATFQSAADQRQIDALQKERDLEQKRIDAASAPVREAVAAQSIAAKERDRLVAEKRKIDESLPGIGDETRHSLDLVDRRIAYIENQQRISPTEDRARELTDLRRQRTAVEQEGAGKTQFGSDRSAQLAKETEDATKKIDALGEAAKKAAETFNEIAGSSGEKIRDIDAQKASLERTSSLKQQGFQLDLERNTIPAVATKDSPVLAALRARAAGADETVAGLQRGLKGLQDSGAVMGCGGYNPQRAAEESAMQAKLDDAERSRQELYNLVGDKATAEARATRKLKDQLRNQRETGGGQS
jgi:hypothetical protein